MFFGICCVVFFLLQPAASDAEMHNASIPAGAFSFEDILVRFGRPLEDLPKLLDGEILVQDIESTSNRELSVSLGMFVPAPPGEVADAMRSIGWFADPENRLADGEITGDTILSAFDGVGFEESDDKAALALYEHPEKSKFNLGKEEIEAFKALKERLGEDVDKQTILEELAQVYKKVLLKRFLEYRNGGPAAIRPYSHDKERCDIGRDLIRATRREVLARRCYPEFCDAISDYPSNNDESVENRFYWLNQRTNERSNFILTHRALSEYPGGVLMSERRFYVSHTYAGQQVLVGVGAIKGGSILFYVNRTISKLVEGFPRKLRHSVGEQRLLERISESFKRMRAKFQD